MCHESDRVKDKHRLVLRAAGKMGSTLRRSPVSKESSLD